MLRKNSLFLYFHWSWILVSLALEHTHTYISALTFEKSTESMSSSSMNNRLSMCVCLWILILLMLHFVIFLLFSRTSHVFHLGLYLCLSIHCMFEQNLEPWQALYGLFSFWPRCNCLCCCQTLDKCKCVYLFVQLHKKKLICKCCVQAMFENWLFSIIKVIQINGIFWQYWLDFDIYLRWIYIYD